MNKLLYPLFALCLTTSASLLLAQSAAAMDDMDKGTMTMEKKDVMGNGAMMEKGSMQKDTMQKDSMDKGMMKKDTMRKKTHARKKTHKQDKMMDDKMQPMK